MQKNEALPNLGNNNPHLQNPEAAAKKTEGGNEAGSFFDNRRPVTRRATKLLPCFGLRFSLFLVVMSITLFLRRLAFASGTEFRLTPSNSQQSGVIVKTSKVKDNGVEMDRFTIIVMPTNGINASDWEPSVWVYANTNLLMRCDPQTRKLQASSHDVPDSMKDKCVSFECSVAETSIQSTRVSLVYNFPQTESFFCYWIYLGDFSNPNNTQRH